MGAEKGKQYTVRISKHKGIRLQKPILFIGECFNITPNFLEFIDTDFNVRVVDIQCDDCVKEIRRTQGNRSRRKSEST